VSLRSLLRSGVAAACIVGTAAPAVLPTVAYAARPMLEVRTAQNRDLTKIEFHWAGGAKVSTRRNGQTPDAAFQP
jgi:hypothetical protein